MNENKEIWKDVVGYEGLYQVSNNGRVKSLWFGKERILKPMKTIWGYLQVDLNKNGERKGYRVHRLVAQTFLPNPDNLPVVNHKDENKENNKVENLEFCDTKYNINYGTRNQRVAEKLTNGKRSKPIFQYTKTGEFIQEWKSATDVERNLGYSHCHISQCCNEKRKSANGFIWKYK